MIIQIVGAMEEDVVEKTVSPVRINDSTVEEIPIIIIVDLTVEMLDLDFIFIVFRSKVEISSS